MSLRLFSHHGNPRSRKVQVAARIANIPIEFVPVALEDTKKKDHIARNPLGKIPVLQTEQGYIFESNAILRYIARQNPDAKLYGSNAYEQGLVDQWLDFSNTELDSLVWPLVVPLLGHFPYDAELAKKASTDLQEKLRILEGVLNGKTNLVGNQLTVADLAIASIIGALYTLYFDENQRKKFPNILKWYETVSARPEWREEFGRTRFLKKAFQIPKTEGTQEKKEKKPEQKEKQEKKPAEKKEEKPKQQQQQQQKPAAEEEPKEEKKTNPLELLPPSPFNIDDYKRQFFANQNDIAGQVKYLFDNVDVNGWSLWIIKYEKAEGEGQQRLKTNNTMKGFLQRLDPHFKKYSFAIWGVYGDEGNYEIQGAWLWRGTEIPAEFKDHPSYEYHKFEKIDPKNSEQSARWAEFWTNQTEDESKVQGLTARELVYWR